MNSLIIFLGNHPPRHLLLLSAFVPCRRNGYHESRNQEVVLVVWSSTGRGNLGIK